MTDHRGKQNLSQFFFRRGISLSESRAKAVIFGTNVPQLSVFNVAEADCRAISRNVEILAKLATSRGDRRKELPALLNYHVGEQTAAKETSRSGSERLQKRPNRSNTLLSTHTVKFGGWVKSLWADLWKSRYSVEPDRDQPPVTNYATVSPLGWDACALSSNRCELKITGTSEPVLRWRGCSVSRGPG